MILRFLIAASILFVACRATEQPQAAREPDPPIVLISIDTLRADHLPAYGYRGIETPALDAFRRDAILYQRAYAPTPMTLPSHVTMLTGMPPTEHGVRDNVGFRFDGKKHATLMSKLRDRGYATGAAVSSFVLRRETGLGELFDAYDDATGAHAGAEFREYQRPGAVTTAAAQQWIAANASRPFFYFLHLYEPHVPYEPTYDADIAAADAIAGGFLSFLKQQGMYDRALIVITSDHGEGLNDHGEDQHSILVYREALQVPLLVKLPRSERAGSSVETPVGLTDIAGIIEGRAPAAHPVYSESLYPRYHFGWSELRSLIDGRWHYIDAPRPELYDIVADPAERNDLSAANRRELATMRDALAKFRDEPPRLGAVDPEAAARLAALGYLGTPRDPRAGPLPNPHDEVRNLGAMREGIAHASAGRLDEAAGTFRRILAKSPDMLEVRIALAEVLTRAGKLDEAEREYRTAMARAEVFSPDLTLALGEVHLAQGKLAEAERAAEGGRAANPRRARLLLADVQLARGDYAGVLRTLEGADGFRVEFLRGDALARLERNDEALAAYRREIERFPRHARAYANLAILYFVTGDRARSEETLRQLEALNPPLAARTRAALR